MRGNLLADDTFNDPKLAISKVYTKTGDRGKTSLVGGQRVGKDHLRIEAYGTIDELNAFLGSAIESITQESNGDEKAAGLVELLRRIQHELFNLGSILATLPEDIHPKQPRIKAQDITQLEREIDLYNEALPLLRSFVLPGGSRSNADLHVCRTICRRAERLLIRASAEETIDMESIQYLNRLSDAFFVWSRWISCQLGKAEVLWQPNRASSAQT